MDYTFYPYYWAENKHWKDMYLSAELDPLFRNFLQAGMARVVVTVKPGFEDAVQFFMNTGKIWNGGEIPVIGDPMYLSIVDELRETPGKPEGKFWITQIPTSLSMMQAESRGLKVDTALPLHEENAENCENPEMLVKKEDLDFEVSGNQIGISSPSNYARFSFGDLDIYNTVGEMDNANVFPASYVCMGREITIDRDAAWASNAGLEVVYKQLAEKLSLIDGVTAESLPVEEKGIEFTVDISRIKTFEFKKPGGNDSFDLLKFVSDGKSNIKFISPAMYINRVSDKGGVALTEQESNALLPLSRFLV